LDLAEKEATATASTETRRMTMEQADYLAGWIDTSIHDFLLKIADPTASMAHALITCVDSESDPASLLDKSKHFKSLHGKCQIVGQGILLTTRQLLSVEKANRIFFGFDEVWFFPDAEISPKPSGFDITGPDQINSNDISQHGEWLRSNKCSLGLGDGTGMNFCLKVRGVARYIVEMFNELSFRSLEDTAKPHK
jgi:hypothetical protein